MQEFVQIEGMYLMLRFDHADCQFDNLTTGFTEELYDLCGKPFKVGADI